MRSRKNAAQEPHRDIEQVGFWELFARLTWSGRWILVGSLLVLCSGNFFAGINAAKNPFVRDLLGVSIEPKIEVRTVKVPSPRNLVLDAKLESWIDDNNKRIRELHTQLLKTEEKAHEWAGFETGKAYEPLAKRLRESLDKEHEAFTRNLAVLKELAK